MKKLVSLLLVGVCALSLAACGGKEDDTLTMATNAEFPPYEYYENDEIVGIDVEIATAIAEELGMKLEVEDMAFDSVIPAVSSGKADIGVAGMTVDPDRLESVNFSDTYADASQVIIVKEDSAIAGPADLEGKSIGVQLGTTGDIYAEDVKDAKVEKYNKGADAVQALKQGKIDAVIIDAEPAKVFVEKNDDLEILDEPFAEEEYAIAMKLDNTELQTAVNGALKELKADGTLDAIKANYVGEDAGKNPYKSPDNVSRDKGTLVMATNAEFPPYESKENDKVVGIDADMMQAVCDKLGYELKIDDMAFDSIISAVQSGKADVGVAGMTVTPDREKNVLFSDTYTSSSQVIIVRKK